MVDSTVDSIAGSDGAPAESQGADLIEMFAGPDAAYCKEKFDRLARDQASWLEINRTAALHGPYWGALRGNWLAFWIVLVTDLVGLMLLARGVFPPDGATGDGSLVLGFGVLAAGRLLIGALADRMYRAQFHRWRIDRSVAAGHDAGRLRTAGALLILVVPLLVYKATQIAPSLRECRRMWRNADKGEAMSFADQFNCYVIGEVPITQRPIHDPIAHSINNSIDWLVLNFEWLFDAITLGIRELLKFLELVFVGTPWPVMLTLLVIASWRAAGRNVAMFVAGSLGYLAVLGFWAKAMSTFSLVGAATVICVALGVPIGIWCAKNARAYNIIRPVLDIMQTLPAFVYLIPAIAFFGVGKPPGILATVIFALPPIVRLTALGVIQVPESVKEAAIAFGATPRQLLWKVELPLAVPSLMTGVNQTIMMSLSMVVVAALIAAKGLGEDVLFALQHVEHGKGLLAGGAIALVAMMMDRVVQGLKGKPR